MQLIEQKAELLAAKLSVSEMAAGDLDAQIKVLQSKKEKILSEVEAFKDDLREGMTANGITRIESKEHGILFRLDAATKRVNIIDEAVLPGKFFRIKKEVDRTAVKKALDVGDDVPGAELINGKNRLTIKV